MQGGIVTPRCLSGRVGSVGRSPTECHSELGTGVHTLQSLIYTYSRVHGHGRPDVAYVPHVLGFLPPPLVFESGELWLQLGREEDCSLPLADPAIVIEM